MRQQKEETSHKMDTLDTRLNRLSQVPRLLLQIIDPKQQVHQLRDSKESIIKFQSDIQQLHEELQRNVELSKQLADLRGLYYYRVPKAGQELPPAAASAPAVVPQSEAEESNSTLKAYLKALRTNYYIYLLQLLFVVVFLGSATLLVVGLYSVITASATSASATGLAASPTIHRQFTRLPGYDSSELDDAPRIELRTNPGKGNGQTNTGGKNGNPQTTETTEDTRPLNAGENK